MFLLSVAICTFLGTMIGGNGLEGFQAFGLQGYEAAGAIGAIVGAITGLIADYFLMRVLMRTAFFRFA